MLRWKRFEESENGNVSKASPSRNSDGALASPKEGGALKRRARRHVGGKNGRLETTFLMRCTTICMTESH